MPPERSTRVMVVEDHPTTLLGFVAILSADPEIEVVAEARSVAAAVRAFTDQRPDVSLIDVRLPDGSALDVLRAIRALESEARAIVITGLEGVEHGYQALRAGALGFLTKAVAPGELIATVKAVKAGQRVVQSDIAPELARVGQPDLTPREREVLALVALGRSNPEIALVLGLSAATVRTHVSRILEKLGAVDRTEAVSLAHRRGLV